MFSHTHPFPSSLSEVSADVSLEVTVTGEQYSTQGDKIYNKVLLFLDRYIYIYTYTIYIYDARNVIQAQYSCMMYNTSIRVPVWHGRSGEHKWVFCVRLQPTYFVWVRCWMILQYTVGRVHTHTHTHTHTYTHTHTRTHTRAHKSNYNTLMPTYTAYLLISFTDSLPHSHTASLCAHTQVHTCFHTHFHV